MYFLHDPEIMNYAKNLNVVGTKRLGEWTSDKLIPHKAANCQLQ